MRMYEEWYVGEVKEALKEVKAGAVVEHEAVARRWGRKRAGKMDETPLAATLISSQIISAATILERLSTRSVG